ncbi:hypothetical protein VTN96DRAFT_8499 [Rasamsonia emersonii]
MEQAVGRSPSAEYSEFNLTAVIRPPSFPPTLERYQPRESLGAGRDQVGRIQFTPALRWHSRGSYDAETLQF